MAENKTDENPMRKICIEKVTLNIGVIKEGGSVEHAKKILKDFSGLEPKVTVTKKRNLFGGSKGKITGCMVTIRKDIDTKLKRLLESVENKILSSSFAEGNFSFGVKEYINIPGTKYDPDIGIMGMDVCVTLARPGFGIRNKRLSQRIGKKHRITKSECIAFAKSIGINVVE